MQQNKLQSAFTNIQWLLQFVPLVTSRLSSRTSAIITSIQIILFIFGPILIISPSNYNAEIK